MSARHFPLSLTHSYHQNRRMQLRWYWTRELCLKAVGFCVGYSSICSIRTSGSARLTFRILSFNSSWKPKKILHMHKMSVALVFFAWNEVIKNQDKGIVHRMCSNLNIKVLLWARQFPVSLCFWPFWHFIDGDRERKDNMWCGTMEEWNQKEKQDLRLLDWVLTVQ